jgi:hypothetical protein
VSIDNRPEGTEFAPKTKSKSALGLFSNSLFFNKLKEKQSLGERPFVGFLQQNGSVWIFCKNCLRCSDYPTSILSAQFFFQQSFNGSSQ